MLLSSTPLKQAFAQARLDGVMLPVFEPLIAANLFVIGALDPDGQPNIALKRAPRPDFLCATVSEHREWLSGIASDRILPITGRALVKLLKPQLDLVIVYDDGGDVIQHEWLEDFRAVLD